MEVAEVSQQVLKQYQETDEEEPAGEYADDEMLTKRVKGTKEPGETEEIERIEPGTTANLPIVRSNTPRLSPYNAFDDTNSMLQKDGISTQQDMQEERYEAVSIPAFPAKPPSAPPVPEAEARFDVIEKSRLPEEIYPLHEEQVVRKVQVARHGQGVQRKQERQEGAIGHITTPFPDSEMMRDELKTSPHSYQLVAFASYLLCLLLIVLTLAIVQGTGGMSDILTANMLLLGVPWMVLVYGLLGGCVSCLVTLGRWRPMHLPGFVVVTWYARPFAAAVLSLFAYLLLNSGLLLSAGGERHQEVAFLVGAAAGLCEGWFFLRRKERTL